MSCLIKCSSTYTNTTKWDLLGPLDVYDFITKVTLKSIKDMELDLLFSIDDIVFSPIYNNMADNLILFENVKKDFQRSKIILKTLTNDQDISDRYIRNEIAYNAKIFMTKINLNIKIDFSVSRISLDVYSHYMKNKETNRIPELKDK